MLRVDIQMDKWWKHLCGIKRLEMEKAETTLGPDPHCDGQCKKQEK